MQNLAEAISIYVQETRRLESIPSSTEPSFYPDVKVLLTTLLRVPVDCDHGFRWKVITQSGGT